MINCRLLILVGIIYLCSQLQFSHALIVVGPACPLEDPMLRPGQTMFNVSLPPFITFTENSLMENFYLLGLSSLRYNISYAIVVNMIYADIEISANKLVGNASKYVVEGYLDARPLPETTIVSGNFTGSGRGEFEVINLIMSGSCKIWISFISDKLQIEELSMKTISFEKFALYFENYIINDNVVQWDIFNRNIKERFDNDWPIHKDILSSKIRFAVKPLLEKYTLDEILEILLGDNCDTEAKTIN